MQRRGFKAERVKKFEKLVERAKKRGISRERLEERIEAFGRIVWLRKWREMNFEEKVGFAERRYGVKVSKKVKDVLWELEKGKIDDIKIKGKEFVVAIPWLYELSFSRGAGVKTMVFWVLGKIGVWNKDVKEILERLSGDEDLVVRKSVARALGRIGVWNDDVGKILKRLGRSRHPWIMHIEVPKALGEIGVWNDVVGEMLIVLGADYDEFTRETIFESLKKIKMDENAKRKLIEKIKFAGEIAKAAGIYFSELDYEKRWLVIEGLFRNRFDRRKFLKDEKYREQLLDLVKAMSVEKLRELVFGKK